MYTNYTSLQKVESSITTSRYTIKHEAHMKNQQSHDNSDKAGLLS